MPTVCNRISWLAYRAAEIDAFLSLSAWESVILRCTNLLLLARKGSHGWQRR